MKFEEIKTVPQVENSKQPDLDDNVRRADILKKTKKVMEGYVLADKRDREENFIGIGSNTAETVENDKKIITQLEKSEGQPDNEARIIENIVIDKGREWMGPDVQFVPLTNYDNHKAHSDVLMEIRSGGEIIRILIDLTTSQNPEIINKKIARSEMPIKNGRLNDVKYFASQTDSFKGELKDIPRVVCGVSGDRLIEACKEIAGDKEVKNLIPYMLLDEALRQLVWFCKKAEQNPYFKEALLVKLSKAADAISELWAKKKTLLNSNDERRVGEDAVYKRLQIQ